MRKDLAATHDDWEAIAGGFHRTRSRPWTDVLAWSLGRLPPEGGRILDLGGGNGRHAIPLAREGYDVVEADFSRALLGHARDVARKEEERLHLAQASATALPLKGASFDGALFIAALHTIPGRANRIAALAELHRVLKPGALALVTVWSRWQEKYAWEFLKELPRALLEGRRDFGDKLVPWREGEMGLLRYYHFYTRAELRADLHAAGFDGVSITSHRIASRMWGDNLFAEIRRPE